MYKKLKITPFIKLQLAIEQNIRREQKWGVCVTGQEKTQKDFIHPTSQLSQPVGDRVTWAKSQSS